MLEKLAGARMALKRAVAGAEQVDRAMPYGPGKHNAITSWYYGINSTSDQIAEIEREVRSLALDASPSELAVLGHSTDGCVSTASSLEDDLREASEHWRRQAKMPRGGT
jgi:hypothetical protein